MIEIRRVFTQVEEIFHEFGPAPDQPLLRGAIDAVDEAFVLFDPEDRLVFCNEKYRSLYKDVRDLLVPGTPFETIIRASGERGQNPAARGIAYHIGTDGTAEHVAAGGPSIQYVEGCA